MTPDPIIVETLERMLEDHCSATVVQEAEAGQWLEGLWSQLEATGLTLTWVPEEHAGAGASLIDGFEVAKVAGRYAVPVPLVEDIAGRLGFVAGQREGAVGTVERGAGPGRGLRKSRARWHFIG